MLQFKTDLQKLQTHINQICRKARILFVVLLGEKHSIGFIKGKNQRDLQENLYTKIILVSTVRRDTHVQ